VELYSRAVSASQVNALFSAGGRKDLAVDFSAPPSEYSTLKRNLDGTYTRTLKDRTTYQFNVQGLQTSMSDRNGNTTTYAYNGNNQLTTITDPAGQVTTLSYSGSRLATITDPAGRVTQLTHDSAGNLATVAYADQTQQRFAYDQQHRITQRIDAQNKVYAYQFDHAGRLQRATLPGGAFREIRPTELTAVPNLAAGQGTPGNPATITQPPIVQATFKDAKGQTTTFETDAIGRVTKQIDPLNRTTTITRDPQGNPLTITRPNGAVTTMTYDAKGNLLASTELSIAATTAFTYEPTFNQVTRITDPKGNQTNLTYDAQGNPLTITDADNKVTRFFYNAQGLLTETRDALYPTNPATTFTYDALGRLLTTTDPLNRTTTLTYDAAGNVATSTDALTRVTSFLYDPKNRLKHVTDPATGVTVYTYDGNGNLLTVKDAKNQTTTFAYDDRNRLLSTTDPLGKVESYSYDGNDNLLTRVTPKAETISFAYDAVNQLLSKTLPGSQITSYQYDLVGNLTNVTDPDSVLAMTYDPANRLTTVKTDGSPNQPAVTLSYGYDRTGNRLSRLDPVQLSTYTYDSLNRLTTLTAPPGQPSATTGLLAAWLGEGTADDAVGGQHGTLQNGVAFAPGQLGQAFQFDGLDDYVTLPDSPVLDSLTTGAALELWVNPELTPTLPQPTFRLLFARRNPNLTESFSVGLTDIGRLLVVVQSNVFPSSSFWSPPGVVTANGWQHIAVSVDLAAGSLQAYVNGQEVPLVVINGPGTLGGTFANVDEGYIGRWQPPDVPASGVGPAYVKGLVDDVRLYRRALTAGEVAAHAIPPNLVTFAYDALSRRTSMTLPNGTSTTYTYDPASQVTHILHQLVSSATQINQAAYAYNPVGNRTSLTDKRGAQGFGYDTLDRLTSATHPLLATPQAFAYDPVGNRTTGGSVVNAGNQLTADTNFAYQYDDNGNLIRKTLLATGNFTQYTYDAENRLIKVEDFVAGNPTPAFTSTYRYDGLGRRIEKVANGQTKRYVYDGEDILLEYDGANVLQARYTHGPGIDEPIAVTKAGSTFFYHQDGLGTVTDLTDSVGATAKSYSYDAYGNVVDQTGTVDQPYTYTGREFDGESGLYYYRARYYDSNLGRFLQNDPGEAGLYNKGLPRNPFDRSSQYAYGANSPISLIDPFGDTPQQPSGVGREGCDYYDKVAAESNCKYHPYAKKFCLNPRLNTCFSLFTSDAVIKKVRKELIEEDMKARGVDQVCTKPSCPRRSQIVQYHKDVYARNGIPQACFPSWWPIEHDGD
jgi:RHS repeat-associated protein